MQGWWRKGETQMFVLQIAIFTRLEISEWSLRVMPSPMALCNKFMRLIWSSCYSLFGPKWNQSNYTKLTYLHQTRQGWQHIDWRIYLFISDRQLNSGKFHSPQNSRDFGMRWTFNKYLTSLAFKMKIQQNFELNNSQIYKQQT